MNNIRGVLFNYLGIVFGLFNLSVYGQYLPSQDKPIYITREQQFSHKFIGINNINWILSSIHNIRYIDIRDQNNHLIEAPSAVSEGSTSRMSINEVPINIKITWRKQDESNPIYSGERNEYWSGGKITGLFRVPIAERIPDELINDLRRDPKGSLRIKIRLHQNGVLLGWDIERRPGFNSKKRDKFGEAVYVKAVHSFAGGDFREAEIYNGKPVRKGWYIHPKTGERIETDF